MDRRSAFKWIGAAVAAGAAPPWVGWLLYAQAPIDWRARVAALRKPAADEVVITAVGDMIISDAVSNRALPEAQAMYQVMRDADVAFGNCEEQIATQGFLAQHFSQMAWPEILDDFKAGGFNMLSIANNHSLDLGEVGLLQWIEESKKRDFTIAGGGRNLDEATTAGIRTVKGQRIGLLAFWCAADNFDTPEYMAAARARRDKSGIGLITGTRVSVPGSPIPLLLPQAADLQTMTDAVRRARARVDFLMISFHQHWAFDGRSSGGPQRGQAPPNRTIVPAVLEDARNLVAEGRKLICRAAVDAGADLVVGHGPHVLNGVEMYKGKPILYSLGHFYMQILKEGKALPAFRFNPSMVQSVENNWYLEEHRWAAVARVFVRRGAVTRLEILPTLLDVQKDGYPKFPADADGQKINAALRELSQPFKTDVRTLGWYSEVVI